MLLSPQGLALSKRLTDASSSPVVSQPHACPGCPARHCWLGASKFPHLVLATWLLFRRLPKRSRWWVLRGQEEGRGFLPLPPVGRAGRAHGRTGVVGMHSPQGGRWQGMFSVPGGWKSLLFWHKALSGQRAQQQVPAEPMQGTHILCSPFITDVVTPSRQPPASYPVSLT